MNASERQLLEFIARLTYNIEGLSLPIKLYISQVLTFHFSKELPEAFIREVENKKAAQHLKTNDEIQDATADFSFEQRAWCLAVLLLLKEQAVNSGNRKLSNSVDRIVAQLTELFGLDGDKAAIEHQKSEIEREISAFQNRKVIRIPVVIWPLVLDFFVRCAVLVYSTSIGRNPSELIAFNVTAIPAFMLLIGFFASRRDRKYNTKLLDSYGGTQHLKIENVISAGRYTWLACILAVSVFVSYLLPIQLHAVAFFGLTVYYFVFLRFFPVGRLDENDLIKQLDNNIGGEERYSVDENDEELVRLETRLHSFTSRLDAYVLESALFGALTFSGFLQIMASDLVSFADLENFAAMTFDTSRALLNLDWQAFDTGLAGLNSKVSLLCLVSLESLICSGFFLAVIASRLRFSDVADRVRTTIEMAKVYNAKEEALLAEHEVTERQPGRLYALTTKISELIHVASASLEKVNPVMTYMRYFRNAGILVFLMILISSSLFITSVLGWTFIALAWATYIYFNFSRLNLGIRASFLHIRITFIRRATRFLVIAVLPIILSVLISMVSPDGAVLLLALGYFTIGLYIFVWLILAAHADQNFGDIDDTKKAGRTGRWLLVKNSFAFTMLMWGIGYSFKQLHLIGADEIIMISLSFLAVLMYFVGYYLSKVRWLGVICGWVLALIAISILFKTLHLRGADEMLTIGVVALILFTPVIVWKRKLFHDLLLRFTTITIILTVFYASGLFWKIQLAASHRSMNVNEIEEVMTVNDADLLLKDAKTIQTGIERCDWYIQSFGKTVGFAPVYVDVLRNYEYYLALSPIEDMRDTTSLTNALKIVRQANKVRALFDYQGRSFSTDDAALESKILLALGRKEDAAQSLESMLKIPSNENFKKELLDHLAAIPR